MKIIKMYSVCSDALCGQSPGNLWQSDEINYIFQRDNLQMNPIRPEQSRRVESCSFVKLLVKKVQRSLGYWITFDLVQSYQSNKH
jgi:hypothetical protein